MSELSPSSNLQQTVHQSQTSLHLLPINNQCSIYLRVVRRDVHHTSQSPDLNLNYDLFGVTFKTTLPITTIKHQLRVEYFSVLQYSSRDLTNIYQFAVKLLWWHVVWCLSPCDEPYTGSCWNVSLKPQAVCLFLSLFGIIQLLLRPVWLEISMRMLEIGLLYPEQKFVYPEQLLFEYIFYCESLTCFILCIVNADIRSQLVFATESSDSFQFPCWISSLRDGIFLMSWCNL